MPSSSQYVPQLNLGRGKRPKLNHQPISMRISLETKEEIEKIAESYDCVYAGKGSISALLNEIASDRLWVLRHPARDGLQETDILHEQKGRLSLRRRRKFKDLFQPVSIRLSKEGKERVEQIAENFGYTYGGKGWIGGLLEQIARKELIVVQKPQYSVSFD